MILPDSKHFRVAEMACHDGTPYPDAFADRWAILGPQVLDVIREAYGSALVVVSGYRTPSHNQALIDRDESSGSHQVASASQHVLGRAADLRPLSGAADTWKLFKVVEDLLAAGELPMLGGYAFYPRSGWVHVDCRERVPVHHIATWSGV